MERCSHQCRRPSGKLDRHPVHETPASCCGHQNCASSRMGGRFTSVGRSQTSWSALTAGLRPAPREPEFHEPGGPRAGWQHEAANRVERQFRATSVLPLLSPSRRAMLRSQSGPAAGVVFFALPSAPLTRFQPALFRVLLQRRLGLPLPLTLRSCRCHRPTRWNVTTTTHGCVVDARSV